MRLFSILTGMLWGIVVGFWIALSLGSAIAGFLWLYVFGDNPWPVSAFFIIIGSIGILFLIPVVVGGVLGDRYARRVADPGTYRPIIIIFLVGIFVIVIHAFFLWQRFESIARSQESSQSTEQSACSILKRLQTITSVTATKRSGGSDYDVQLVTAGPDKGVYALHVDILADYKPQTLISVDRSLTLLAEKNTISTLVSEALLKDAYAKKMLTYPAAVRVKGDFPVHITLTPMLPAEEMSTISARYYACYGTRTANLTEQKQTTLSVDFLIQP